MREYKEFILGTNDYPLPDMNKDGMLGVRHDNSKPLIIPSTVTPPEGIELQDYLYGILMRNLPTRNMLRVANEQLDNLNQMIPLNERVFIGGLEGGAGSGKTFEYELIGKLLNDEGVLFVDASNKDMNTLFHENIFSPQTAMKEKAAIDSKLKLRNQGIVKNIESLKKAGLSDDGLEILSEICGEALTTDDRGIISVDWNGIEIAGENTQEKEYNSDVFKNMLKVVCQMENIPISEGGMELGIKDVDGKLVEALTKGLPILADELNRAKRGTIDNLYNVFNALSDPNKKSLELEGAGGRKISIKKEDIPSTFRFWFTGNPGLAEGMGSNEFNLPFLSRVAEGFILKRVPDTTPEGFSDMVSSSLMGVPGTLINDSFDFKSDGALVDFLMKVRTWGMTKEQVDAIPADQIINIKDAPKIVQLSKQMGAFLYEIDDLCKRQEESDSISKLEDGIDIDPLYAKYLRKKMLDFRITPNFTRRAMYEKGDIEKIDVVHMKEGANNQISHERDEKVYERRGDNLIITIDEWLQTTFMPPDMKTLGINETAAKELYTHVRDNVGIRNGIFPTELSEARVNNNFKLVSELYKHDVKGSSAARQLQEIIIYGIEKKYGHQQGTPEDIVPLLAVKQALDDIRQNKENISQQLRVSEEMSAIVVPNQDMDTVYSSPLKNVMVVEHDSLDGGTGVNINPEKLTDINTFLGGFVNADTIKLNRCNLWNKTYPEEAAQHDDLKKPISIIEGTNGEFAANVVAVKKGNDVSLIYVFTNITNEKSLIVGTAISDNLKLKLKKNDYTYLDRDSQKDMASLERSLSNLLGENDSGKSKGKYTTSDIKEALCLKVVSAEANSSITDIVKISTPSEQDTPTYVTDIAKPSLKDSNLILKKVRDNLVTK